MGSDRPFTSFLVAPKELHDALQNDTSAGQTSFTRPRIIPLAAGSFHPGDGRRGIDAFLERRIPGARFFELNKVVDKNSHLPNMLPSAEDFAIALGALGIGKEDTVVVYDTYELGITSAPRVAWTLRVFGHERVHVLNNFRLWVEGAYPIESGTPGNVERCPYPTPRLDASKVASFDEVKSIVSAHTEGNVQGAQILDARPYGRWTGRDPELRPDLSSGHMPGSINVPASDLLDPQTKAFLPAQQLRGVFQDKGVDPARPIITTCGAGVTAAVVYTALEVAGFGDGHSRRLYDGSWTEWAQRVKPTDGLIEKSTK